MVSLLQSSTEASEEVKIKQEVVSFVLSWPTSQSASRKRSPCTSPRTNHWRGASQPVAALFPSSEVGRWRTHDPEAKMKCSLWSIVISSPLLLRQEMRTKTSSAFGLWQVVHSGKYYTPLAPAYCDIIANLPVRNWTWPPYVCVLLPGWSGWSGEIIRRDKKFGKPK